MPSWVRRKLAPRSCSLSRQRGGEKWRAVRDHVVRESDRTGPALRRRRKRVPDFEVVVSVQIFLLGLVLLTLALITTSMAARLVLSRSAVAGPSRRVS